MKRHVMNIFLLVTFISLMTFASKAEIEVSNHVQTYMVDEEPRILNGIMYKDENYVKLRDFSHLLKQLNSDFKIAYDAEKRAINIDTKQSYTPIGGEFLKITKLGTAVLSDVKLYVDGVSLNYKAINVDGFNYFRLRDLAETFKIGVDYDMKSGVVNLSVEGEKKPKLSFKNAGTDRRANSETIEVSRNQDGSIYVYYSIEVNTGGYSVVTKDVYLDGNTIVIVPEITRAEGMVTQVISYPSTAVEITGDIPQNFEIKVEGQKSSVSIM